MCPCSDSKIYGLINGIEEAINEKVFLSPLSETQRIITKDELKFVYDVLDEYTGENLSSFKGYYTIERKLQERGIDREKAIKIFTYLKLDSRYSELIEKMNSKDSPVEVKDLTPFESEI